MREFQSQRRKAATFEPAACGRMKAATLPASEMDAMSGQEKQLTAVHYERHKRIEAQYSVHYDQATSWRASTARQAT